MEQAEQVWRVCPQANQFEIKDGMKVVAIVLGNDEESEQAARLLTQAMKMRKALHTWHALAMGKHGQIVNNEHDVYRRVFEITQDILEETA